MIRNVLSNIPGIEYYPIAALLIFLVFFVSLIVWFFCADRSRLEVISRIPLDDEQTDIDLAGGSL